MQNQISVFQFQAAQNVRVEVQNGEPWFCLKDVAEILEIQNAKSSRFNLKTKGIAKISVPTAGGKQELTFIDEPNLYRVIFRSNKAEAVKFQDWIFEEVIPQIRKTGSYQARTTPDQRAGLRKAVGGIVAARHLNYSEAYNLVHQRFGVEHIDQIPEEDLADAVKYCHALTLDNTLHGEILDALALPTVDDRPVISEQELSQIATVLYYCDWATKQLKELSISLYQLGANHKASAAKTLWMESQGFLRNSRATIERLNQSMSEGDYKQRISHCLERMNLLQQQYRF